MNPNALSDAVQILSALATAEKSVPATQTDAPAAAEGHDAFSRLLEAGATAPATAVAGTIAQAAGAASPAEPIGRVPTGFEKLDPALGATILGATTLEALWEAEAFPDVVSREATKLGADAVEGHDAAAAGVKEIKGEESVLMALIAPLALPLQSAPPPVAPPKPDAPAGETAQVGAPQAAPPDVPGFATSGVASPQPVIAVTLPETPSSPPVSIPLGDAVAQAQAPEPRKAPILQGVDTALQGMDVAAQSTPLPTKGRSGMKASAEPAEVAQSDRTQGDTIIREYAAPQRGLADPFVGSALPPPAPVQTQAPVASAPLAPAPAAGVDLAAAPAMADFLSAKVASSVRKPDATAPAADSTRAGTGAEIRYQREAPATVPAANDGAAQQSFAQSRFMAALDPQASVAAAQSAPAVMAGQPAPQKPDVAQAAAAPTATVVQGEAAQLVKPAARAGSESEAVGAADQAADPAPQQPRARSPREPDMTRDTNTAPHAIAGTAEAADTSVQTRPATTSPVLADAAPAVASLAVSERTALASGTTAAATAPAEPQRGASPHALAHQMAQALSDSSNRPVELTLAPEELGKVRMTMHSTETSITLSLQAERPETLDLMRRNIDLLARDFREMGYTNISFDFGQQQDRQPTRQDQSAFTDTTEREMPLRFETASIAPQTASQSDTGGLDLRI